MLSGIHVYFVQVVSRMGGRSGYWICPSRDISSCLSLGAGAVSNCDGCSWDIQLATPVSALRLADLAKSIALKSVASPGCITWQTLS
jgi:hypothetical protein